MKRKILLTLAVFTLAVLFAGAALAQTAPTPGRPDLPALFQTFLDRFAANLGVDKEKLAEAARQAEQQVIDEAVQQGKMTQDQAAKIKERLQNDPWFFLGRFPGHRQGKGPDLALLAQALGMSQDELQARLKEGKRIDEIAAAQGLTVDQLREKMQEARIQAIQQAVKDGKLTQDKADELIQRLQNAPQHKGFGPFDPSADKKFKGPKGHGLKPPVQASDVNQGEM